MLAWAGGHWLMSVPSFAEPAARVPVVAFAPLIAALLLGPTLTGADEELERATPLPWPAWRMGHVLIAAILIAGALTLIGLRAPAVFGAWALLRNTIACTGLVAGGAVLLGARLAWLPAFGYVSFVYAAAPRTFGGIADAWAWPVQPSTVHASWWAAAALFILGTGWYLLRGPRARDTGS